MPGLSSGDTRAFAEIFDRYHGLVYAIALGILANRDLAEEVSQSIFLKVWEKPSAFRGGSFTAWLARVTQNLSIDMLRHNASIVRGEMRSYQPETVLPFDRVLADIDAVQLHRSLLTLTESQRALISLCYFQEMTHTQIAHHTGIPLGTVKTRLRAGLAQLRKSLFVPAEPEDAGRRH